MAFGPALFEPGPFAARLLAARRGRRAVAWDGEGAPADYAGGVAVQRALAGLLGADPPAGFKIGGTTARMRSHLGVADPIAGFMASAGLHGDGSVLGYGGFNAPGVECELAVVLRSDLPGPCTAAEAAAAAGELMAAIELVENRYAPGPPRPPVLVADAMYHAGCVLGAPGEQWRELDLRAIEGVLTIDGAERGRGAGAELLGGPMDALAWLAGSPEARAFGGLRAGQVVTLGSVTTPVWLDGPCRVTVSFAPLPAVSLTLV